MVSIDVPGFPRFFRIESPHLDAMSVVNELVEDAISQHGIADLLVRDTSADGIVERTFSHPPLAAYSGPEGRRWRSGSRVAAPCKSISNGNKHYGYQCQHNLRVQRNTNNLRDRGDRRIIH
jgi:hypothetical protein